MRLNHAHLRLLGRVQTQVQHQTMEGVHGPVQLVTRGSLRGRQDIMHAWWVESGVEQSRPDQWDSEAYRCAGPRFVV